MEKFIDIQELNDLAKYFPENKPLYVVGGAVRDKLRLNALSCDIDVCAAMDTVELREILKGSKFKIIPSSERLGTVLIKGERVYEFTAFRKDSYPKGSGVHKPTEISFTSDINQDAKRRDFKCNAIYYDIANDKIVDLLGGIKDIENKLLSTTVSPYEVLAQDGLRIMRLYRFASTLGYDIEEETKEAAVKLVDRLDEISPERIQVELSKLLLGEYADKALEMISQNRVLERLFGVTNESNFLKLIGDVEDRLAVLLSCLYEKVGGDAGEFCKSKLGKYKYKNYTVDRVARIVATVMQLESLNGDYREFAMSSFDIADIVAYICKDKSKSDMLLKERDYIVKRSLPKNILELKVDGQHIKELGYKGKEIGRILNELFIDCLYERVENDKQELLRRVKDGRI